MGKRRFDEQISRQEWEQPDKLKKIEEWAGQGLTLADIAANIGISRTALYDWRKESPVITSALKKGDDKAIDKAENALYELALSGNLGALCFYLKNKRPDRWKDKRENEITGNGKMSFAWSGGKDGATNTDTVPASPDMA